MRRLEAALSLIESGSVLADVGCDHGLLCLSALQSGKAVRVYACDISEASLNKARQLLGGDERARFYRADGLLGVPDDYTALTICGMGGLEMLRIAEKANKTADIILQPQTHAATIRRQMSCSGYALTAEITAVERGRYYPVMKFSRGYKRLDELQLRFGLNAHEPPAELTDYLRKRQATLRRYPPTTAHREELCLIEEVLKCR